MLERLRASRLTLLVSSVVVLFVAFGGQAQAVKKAKKNSVVAKSIKAGAVKASKIADGAVSTAKLADEAVTARRSRTARSRSLIWCRRPSRTSHWRTDGFSRSPRRPQPASPRRFRASRGAVRAVRTIFTRPDSVRQMPCSSPLGAPTVREASCHAPCGSTRMERPAGTAA